MSETSDMSMIKKILEQMGSGVTGVQHCMLMDKTGLLIASYTKYVSREIDADAAGAIVGAVFQAGEEEGNTTDLGSLEIQINEFTNGFRFAVACEDMGVLSVIADKDVQIGLLRASMKKYAPYLGKLMKKMFSTTNQGVMEDLKDLFSYDSESFL